MPRSPPWTDMHLIWHSRRGRRRNHLWQSFWWSVDGFRFCGGSKIALSHWPIQWPLTQGRRYRAACDFHTVILKSCVSNDTLVLFASTTLLNSLFFRMDGKVTAKNIIITSFPARGYLPSFRASPSLAGTIWYCLVNKGTCACTNNLPSVTVW